jgi:hypothetical protein
MADKERSSRFIRKEDPDYAATYQKIVENNERRWSKWSEKNPQSQEGYDGKNPEDPQSDEYDWM